MKYLALIVVAACATPSAAGGDGLADNSNWWCGAIDPPRVGPGLALVAFEGPFSSEGELCTHVVASIVADLPWAEDPPPRCVTSGPSFTLPAPTLPAGLDRITQLGPWRTVHVARVTTDNIAVAEANRCLLVIETAHGWFASSDVVVDCQLEGSGSTPVGGFQAIGSELIIDTGEQHRGACGDCAVKTSIRRALCGVDHHGAPRCTPPISTLMTDDDGIHHRTWTVDHGRLVVGQLSRFEDGHEVTRPLTQSWLLDFGAW